MELYLVKLLFYWHLPQEYPIAFTIDTDRFETHLLKHFPNNVVLIFTPFPTRKEEHGVHSLTGILDGAFDCTLLIGICDDADSDKVGTTVGDFVGALVGEYVGDEVGLTVLTEEILDAIKPC